jgi:hypothetical protein
MSKLDEGLHMRKYFDIKDKNDIKRFRDFVVNSAWSPAGCPFILEEPFLTIPDMIRYKIANEFLGIKNG